MHFVVITRPDFFEKETSLVNFLFANGLECLHLRKPNADSQEIANWIEQIDLPYRDRIVLHDYHDLARLFSLGGIHLNKRNPTVPVWFNEECKKRAFTKSCSCHSIKEVEQYASCYDYVFLSPIFDSISKEGYGAAFTKSELEKACAQGLFENKVYALGGVSIEQVPIVRDFGFAGIAVLGGFWGKISSFSERNVLVDRYRKFLSLLC
ncbi:MAG: thiamine phosphate synthase [Bacteroidales bacterium]|nr:thiamine phosphate synthase [Bacteroidales bacterium]